MMMVILVSYKDATYKQQFVLEYTGTVITSSLRDVYKAEIENQLSSVQSELQTQCRNSMGINAPIVVLSPTVIFIIVGGKVCITVVASLSCLSIVDNMFR